MIVVRPFEPADLDRIEEADAPDPLRRDRAFRLGMAELGPTFTAAEAATGRLLLVAGMAVNHPGSATAWTVRAARIGAAHLALTRATARVIAAAGFVRVDMIVGTDNAAGHRWARALGFVREGTLRAWADGGHDVDIYARVRTD